MTQRLLEPLEAEHESRTAPLPEPCRIPAVFCMVGRVSNLVPCLSSQIPSFVTVLTSLLSIPFPNCFVFFPACLPFLSFLPFPPFVPLINFLLQSSAGRSAMIAHFVMRERKKARAHTCDILVYCTTHPGNNFGNTCDPTSVEPLSYCNGGDDCAMTVCLSHGVMNYEFAFPSGHHFCEKMPFDGVETG